jgi:hypothetical protein
MAAFVSVSGGGGGVRACVLVLPGTLYSEKGREQQEETKRRKGKKRPKKRKGKHKK